MTIRIVSVALLLLAQLPLSASAATCAGANPAVTSIAVQNVAKTGNVNEYHLMATVKNLGSTGQGANTLQFVDIYDNGSQQRLSDHGVPPLAAGQSYSFGYVWRRATDAGDGTTTLEFRMRMVDGTNCNTGNSVKKVTF